MGKEHIKDPTTGQWVPIVRGPVPANEAQTVVLANDSGKKTLIDDTTTPGFSYIGKADPGTATSAASWQIQRLRDTPFEQLWANGSTSENQVWDNRASLSYS